MPAATNPLPGLEAPLDPLGGQITLQPLIDAGSIEVFGNDGRVAMSRAFRPDPGARASSGQDRG
ncbi:MAG: GH32 C-terminal domain-containing protein [Isosphaeraceae bacterium]